MLRFNNTSIIQGAAIAVFCAFLLACNGDDGDKVVSSEFVETAQIYATIDVYSNTATAAYASVQLTKDAAPRDNTPGDEYVKLQAGDQLWMTTGTNLDDIDLNGNLFSGLEDLSKTQELFESEIQGYPVFPLFFFFWSAIYETQVNYNGRLNDVDEGASYTVSLLREYKQDARYSTVTMPLGFDLTAPQTTDEFSRSEDDLLIEWWPVEDGVNVEISLNTDCPAFGSDSVLIYPDEDEGLALIEAGALASENLGGNCTTSLTLAKRRTGQLDASFTGGYISANQVRSLSFTTTD